MSIAELHPEDTQAEIAAAEEVADVCRRDATIMEIARVIAMSRDFPDARTPEKAAVRILAGREMGIGPIQSVMGIRIQNGRVSMDAGLMASRIKNDQRYDYKVVAHDNDVCELAFFENDGNLGVSRFTMQDAATAKLANKDTWQNFPRNMLFARALSNGARWFCAGIFGGSVYTHEELGLKVDGDGNLADFDASVNELCTRDQRQEITQLVNACDGKMESYLATLGIRLLDELTQQEANAEIKKLKKKCEKLAKTAQGPSKASAGDQEANAVTPEKPQQAETQDGSAQEMLQEAFDDSRRPSTHEQHDWILRCMKKLVPDENECMEALVAVLAKRNCTKRADLTYQQAASLIQKLEEQLGKPPFDPPPSTSGNDTSTN